MSHSITRPTALTGAKRQVGLWQRTEMQWDYDPSPRTILSELPAESPMAVVQKAANVVSLSSSTAGPQEVPPATPPAVTLERRSYGLRSLEPISEWEVVVDNVDNNGFQCRLVRLANGATDPTKIELTEFSFDDLERRTDHSLIVRGAVLYWTIGRFRNAAGTVTNQSLLRLRRLPAPTLTQVSDAERAAERILHALGMND
jgi:hypothetical protein